MSGVNFSFNANTVDPNVAPEPVPTGIYTVAIAASAEKPVNGKAGQFYMQFDMKVQEGDYKGRTITARLNHKNENEQARTIAYGDLSAICHVTGVMEIRQSTAELHNRPFKVNVVKIQRNDDPTKESNEIRGYLDMAGNPPGKKGAAASGNAASSGFGSDPAPSNGPSAPAAPAAPAAAPAAPAVHDPKAAAIADGWIQHPQSEPHAYKGTEVVAWTDLVTRYAVPNGSAAAPATPPVPASPDAPASSGASAAADSSIPSWAQ